MGIVAQDGRGERQHVELVELTADELPVLDRLMQLYLHELSGSAPELIRIGDDGLFDYRWTPSYLTDADRHAYLLRHDGRLAGFALVRALETGGWEMAEFSVLAGERGAGVGRAAVRAVLARHPGRWSVRQLAGNTGATRFWRKAIPVPFDEVVRPDGRIEQRFAI